MGNLIRISESNDFIVDYDKDRRMYRVSVFEDNHYQDEYWFDAYGEKEAANKIEKIIELPEYLNAPITANEAIGCVKYQLKGKTVYST